LRDRACSFASVRPPLSPVLIAMSAEPFEVEEDLEEEEEEENPTTCRLCLGILAISSAAIWLLTLVYKVYDYHDTVADTCDAHLWSFLAGSTVAWAMIVMGYVLAMMKSGHPDFGCSPAEIANVCCGGCASCFLVVWSAFYFFIALGADSDDDKCDGMKWFSVYAAISNVVVLVITAICKVTAAVCMAPANIAGAVEDVV